MDPKEQYHNIEYDDLFRFISYFYQIDLVRKLSPKSILEIGVGNKTVSNYLKQSGFNVITCDINPKSNPDYVADIRNLPFEKERVDLVLACEVLEHISFKEVELALKELRRVTKKYVVISIPYISFDIDWVLKTPRMKRIFKQSYLRLLLRLPLVFWKRKFTGGHYWEMGTKNYPISKIRKLLKQNFKIIREITPVLDSYHYFFVLEKN